MYAFEFLQNRSINGTMVFLSGDNAFVRNMVIEQLLKCWSITKTITANKPSDIKVYGNLFIFNQERIAYILEGKAEPKSGLEFIIKISSGKITKKYKDLGFIEISCHDLFPNQVEALCHTFLSDYGVSLAQAYIKFICMSCNYDLVAINNIIKLLSFLDVNYLNSLSYQDFALVCGGLSTTEESPIIGYFIDGDYSAFLSKLNENPRLVSGVLWGLTYALLKVKDTMITKNNSWYQRKLTACGKRLEHYGIDRVIVFTHDLAGSFSLKFPQIMLALNILINNLKET